MLRLTGIACASCALAGLMGLGVIDSAEPSLSARGHDEGAPDIRHAPVMDDSVLLYRGNLSFQGAAFDGVADMEFRLFAGEFDDVQIGETVAANSWPVTAGEFLVRLDFGPAAGALLNADVSSGGGWLEITVNDAVLSPRQFIAPAGWAVAGEGAMGAEADALSAIAAADREELMKLFDEWLAARADVLPSPSARGDGGEGVPNDRGGSESSAPGRGQGEGGRDRRTGNGDGDSHDDNELHGTGLNPTNPGQGDLGGQDEADGEIFGASAQDDWIFKPNPPRIYTLVDAVGIETKQPTANLDVNGDVRIREAFQLNGLFEEPSHDRALTMDGNGNVGWRDWPGDPGFWAASGGSNPDAIYYDDQVTVGRILPFGDNLLSVNGDAAIAGSVTIDPNEETGGNLTVAQTVTATEFVGMLDWANLFNIPSGLITSARSPELQVNGNQIRLAQQSANDGEVLKWDDGANAWLPGSSGDSIWQQDINPGDIYWIGDGGYGVGIGTSSPFAKLHVAGGAIVDNTLEVGGRLEVTGNLEAAGQIDAADIESTGDISASADGFFGGNLRSELLGVAERGWFGGDSLSGIATLSARGGDGNLFALLVDTGGSGTTTAIRGDALGSSGVRYGVVGYSQSSAGYDFYATGPGQDYGSNSSRRWKRNIEVINGSLERLSQLRGVYFDWDANHGGHHDIGMIAEEVGLILPEIVEYEENGIDAIGMDYSKLSPLLVEAIKALRAEKDAEVGHLNSRIAELEALVAELVAAKNE